MQLLQRRRGRECNNGDDSSQKPFFYMSRSPLKISQQSYTSQREPGTQQETEFSMMSHQSLRERERLLYILSNDFFWKSHKCNLNFGFFNKLIFKLQKGTPQGFLSPRNLDTIRRGFFKFFWRWTLMDTRDKFSM